MSRLAMHRLGRVRTLWAYLSALSSDRAGCSVQALGDALGYRSRDVLYRDLRVLMDAGYIERRSLPRYPYRVVIPLVDWEDRR